MAKKIIQSCIRKTKLFWRTDCFWIMVFRNFRLNASTTTARPGHDVKIIIENLNAQLALEDECKPTIGKFHAHQLTNGNCQRLIDFVSSKIMTNDHTQHIFPTQPPLSWYVSGDRHSSGESQSDHFLMMIKLYLNFPSSILQHGIGQKASYNGFAPRAKICRNMDENLMPDGHDDEKLEAAPKTFLAANQ